MCSVISMLLPRLGAGVSAQFLTEAGRSLASLLPDSNLFASTRLAAARRQGALQGLYEGAPDTTFGLYVGIMRLRWGPAGA